MKILYQKHANKYIKKGFHYIKYFLRLYKIHYFGNNRFHSNRFYAPLNLRKYIIRNESNRTADIAVLLLYYYLKRYVNSSYYCHNNLLKSSALLCFIGGKR